MENIEELKELKRMVKVLQERNISYMHDLEIIKKEEEALKRCLDFKEEQIRQLKEENCRLKMQQSYSVGYVLA